MEIKQAVFLTSSTNAASCPKTRLPEFAFIGRSNVGKSSLINMITGEKKLAKTSQTPGKTQLINHFLINEKWYIVDLPGYGFAKVSIGEKEKFQKRIKDYILNRRSLVYLFLLVDCRHTPQKIDLDFIEWLGENQIPFVIVFTKQDKLNKTSFAKNMKNYKEKLLQTWEELPPVFISSSVTGKGKEEILGFVSEVLEQIRKEGVFF